MEDINQSDLGIFTSFTTIGRSNSGGFVRFDPQTQTYLLSGTEDELNYLWTSLQGDFIVRAEVKWINEAIAADIKAGWLIKSDLSAGTPALYASMDSSGHMLLKQSDSRDEFLGKSQDSEEVFSVIQLERRGSSFIMSGAAFGQELKAVEITDQRIDKNAFVGLFLQAHHTNDKDSVIFRNVSIIQSPTHGGRASPDFGRSHLEILDVNTGYRKKLFGSSYPIQAPNWTSDGKYLIYNCDGRLYKYDLSTHATIPIETGPAVQNNNDHVLTFDGTLLGISNHDPDENGQSTIYFLPSEGSEAPKRVTLQGYGASYLHGWSPDNQIMLFTGERNGQFDIYAVDVNTGAETQLTNHPKLDDGSEYSPDGQYIYFNSARTGKMKIWRMLPDGSDQTQITFDRYNDWFPHLSPNQRSIVFLSYPEEVAPEEHPFYRHCTLRIMDYPQGIPRIIAYIYGGQGTINVPSWSPDSQKLAFVSNTYDVKDV